MFKSLESQNPNCTLVIAGGLYYGMMLECSGGMGENKFLLIILTFQVTMTEKNNSTTVSIHCATSLIDSSKSFHQKHPVVSDSKLLNCSCIPTLVTRQTKANNW